MKTQVYLEEEINGLCMGIILYMHRAKFNDRGIVLANHIIIMASVINKSISRNCSGVVDFQCAHIRVRSIITHQHNVMRHDLEVHYTLLDIPRTREIYTYHSL